MHAATERVFASVDATRSLGSLIREYADEIERTCVLPRPLFEALADAGLFRMVVCADAGGQEIDFPTYLDVIEEVARADASTAWCVNQASSFQTYSPVMPIDVARLIFEENPRGVVANTPAATGTAIAEAGGYRVTGTFSYGTGCHHASWVAARAQILDDGVVRRTVSGDAEIRYFMLPAEEAEILDTWNVRGLRGTGTHHWRVADAFVPEERTFSPDAVAAQERAPIYVIPRQILAACGDAMTALGVARDCVDTFVRMAQTKRAANMAGLLRDESLVQYDVGLAEAELRSSRMYLRQTVREVWTEVERTHAITLGQKADLRLAAVHAIRQSASVVDAMYNAAGATAVLKDQPIQRHFQDVHVVTQHMQSRRAHYELVGKVVLGLNPTSTFL
ncbi:MAG: acyl-CoA dehydrogenase family protein [Chloroflexi bacterium]|nr:acyl-CoA dehydrogenase family protein [Chloroflexota bacterium]